MTSFAEGQAEGEDLRDTRPEDSAELYRLLVATVRDYAIFALDASGHVLTWNAGAAHLKGMTLPPIGLLATDDRSVTLLALRGRTVVFAYPRTGEPGKIALVDDWDMIPGARGCTPQTCAFRDLFAELKAAGASHVFGLSTQSNDYQIEMASRLHLPFPVLSDEKLALTRALKLPTMEVAGLTLIKRLALIIDDARITHVFYPVFPPDRNAGDVLDWLKANPVK